MRVGCSHELDMCFVTNHDVRCLAPSVKLRRGPPPDSLRVAQAAPLAAQLVSTPDYPRCQRISTPSDVPSAARSS